MVDVPPEIEAFLNKLKYVSGFLVDVTVALLTLTLFIRDVLVTTPAISVWDALLTADRNSQFQLSVEKQTTASSPYLMVHVYSFQATSHCCVQKNTLLMKCPHQPA